MTDGLATEVLNYWFGHGNQYGIYDRRWFVKNDAFDAEIRSRFASLHDTLSTNRHWLDQPRECLARVIVLDQFPRNMFRGTPRAFASDALALEAARIAVERGWDRGMLEVEKLFVYLPFEHSEALADQDRACELMRDFDADQRGYAERHRDIIRRFGRFPHRNAILGRASTSEELDFLKQPGSGF